MNNQKKLVLPADIAATLAIEGVTLTPNAVRSRLKETMVFLVEESCKALGVDVDDDELERIAGSRAFQEAVASLLNHEETIP